MNILLIGQCTLHWGRMEYGNIGNYYILEPMIRELHTTFGKDTHIETTFQLSSDFCNKEQVSVLPMELYYAWRDNEIELAEYELEIAEHFFKTNELLNTTPYIEAVLNADLVIDFSGDIWGDNADFLGDDRFYVGLIKDRVSQLLHKKTAMIAGSPGPFNNAKVLPLARLVFENFDVVTNRESLSVDLLKDSGFNVDNLHNLSCPAFLFEPTSGDKKETLLNNITALNASKRPLVGVIVCGWNFEKGPFDLWPRSDSDYNHFVDAIEAFAKDYDVDFCFMSHSNGFPIPPAKFKLIHGRDYPIIKQLQTILVQRGNIAKERLLSIDGIYSAWDTKALISGFDMVVSGRVHAAVAAMSQCVPTVILDYGHEPKAHKLKGFAIEAGMLKYVADPANSNDILEKMQNCWKTRLATTEQLKINLVEVKAKAKKNFSVLKELFN